MRGTLGLFNLFELLQLLNSNARTGALIIKHPRFGETRIYFVKGRIVHAAHKNVFDEGVIYNILMDERGDFEFQTARTAVEETLTQSFEQLMFDVIRMMPAETQVGMTLEPDPSTTSTQDGSTDYSKLTIKQKLRVAKELKGLMVALEQGVLERWEVQLDERIDKVKLRFEGGREIVLRVEGRDGIERRDIMISSEALMYHGLQAGQVVLVRPEL
jgi:hypothetical protein